jgi:flagellar biosynthetic protein FliS
MNGIRAYRTQKVHTAPNEQLLLMLLESAINAQSNAAEAMERGERAAWNQEIGQSRAIFIELMTALDHKVAPALTRNLHMVYAWAIHQLTESAKTGNVETLYVVHKVTCTLYHSWLEVVQGPGAAAAEAS